MHNSLSSRNLALQDLKINESTGLPVLNESLTTLKDHVEGVKALTAEEIDKTLDMIISELIKTVPHRVLAGKLNAQQYFLRQIEAEIARDQGDQYNPVSLIKLYLSDSSNVSPIFRLSTNWFSAPTQ